MNDLITFIIPTIGRLTLIDSIKSLLNQSDNRWNAIIIFDGIECNIDKEIISDSRIKYYEIEKCGRNINQAGFVRNYAINKLVEDCWIAFLDDDDIISNDYIETFFKELELYQNVDVYIYRMLMGERIVPKLDESNNFFVSDVGISFILKKKIFDDGLDFIPDSAEDYLLLNRIRELDYKIMISPYVKYFVKNSKIDNFKDLLGNRVFINMDNPLLTLL